jgi:type VI protein secretion system component VasF
MNNTQQDHELAEKIAQLLSEGTQRLDAGTAARLLEARKQALAHFNEQPQQSSVLALATQGVSRMAEPFSNNLRAWAVLAALLFTLAGAITWQSVSTQGSELADIDEGLLTSELPINAYLDRSIDSWLKRPAH